MPAFTAQNKVAQKRYIIVPGNGVLAFKANRARPTAHGHVQGDSVNTNVHKAADAHAKYEGNYGKKRKQGF